MNDSSPIQPIYDNEAVAIGELIPTIMKRAVMAAWEAGEITALEAWWLIQREGLQHK